MNKEDKILMFDCLNKLNDAIKCIGHYNFGNNDLQTFIMNNDIYIERYGKRHIKAANAKHNYIVLTFDSTISDKAHDILRHFRNSIAHSLVKKPKGKQYYQFQDKNKCGNESMVARIRTDLFKSLIENIIQTYH